jgi:hypothetical protein
MIIAFKYIWIIHAHPLRKAGISTAKISSTKQPIPELLELSESNPDLDSELERLFLSGQTAP